MDIRTEKREEVTIVSVKGRMDAVASPEFDRELNDRMAGGEKIFIIDFAELDYISSAGLRSVLAAAKRLKEHGGQLSLASLKEVVREVVQFPSMGPRGMKNGYTANFGGLFL